MTSEQPKQNEQAPKREARKDRSIHCSDYDTKSHTVTHWIQPAHDCYFVIDGPTDAILHTTHATAPDQDQPCACGPALDAYLTGWHKTKAAAAAAAAAAARRRGERPEGTDEAARRARVAAVRESYVAGLKRKNVAAARRRVREWRRRRRDELRASRRMFKQLHLGEVTPGMPGADGLVSGGGGGGVGTARLSPGPGLGRDGAAAKVPGAAKREEKGGSEHMVARPAETTPK